MSGGDGRDQGNTGLGHNGGKPSGNINGSSGSSNSNSNNNNGGIPTHGLPGDNNNIMHAIPNTGNEIHWGGGGNSGDGNSNTGSNDTVSGTATYWNQLSPTAFSNKKLAPIINKMEVAFSGGIATYILYWGPSKIKIVVHNDNPATMDIQYLSWKGPKERSAQTAKEYVTDFIDFKTASSMIISFYSTLGAKYGEKLQLQAQSLAREAQGKKLRNHRQAMNAFNKYQGNLNKKFGVADRNAISKSLESLDKNAMAKNIKYYAKILGYVGVTIDFADFTRELANGFRTGNWDKAIIKGESIVANKAASALVAVAFSIMTTTTIGIIGFAFIMAIVGALITDKKLKEINDFIVGL